MTIKRPYYFVELDNGTTRKISEREYLRKRDEYIALAWDYEEYSCNFINTPEFVQYDNYTTFYMKDDSFTIGYCQREIY